MTDPTERDAALKEYLEGDSALSRAYRASFRELPPAHLDARILSEARRADAPVPAVPGPFSGRWMVPASLAVIVLAVSVVALLPEPDVPLPAIREDPSERVIGGQASPRSEAGPAFEDRGGEADRAAPSLMRKSDRPELNQAAGSAVPEARELAPVPGDLPAAGAAGEPSEPAAGRPAAETAAPLTEDAGTPAGARVPQKRRPSTAISGYDLRREELREPAPATARERQTRAPSAESGRERSPAAGAVPDPAPPKLEFMSPASPADDGQAFTVAPDAAAWLARISRLVENGELDAAAEELDAFRRRHPSVEIPPAILTALETVN